MAGGLSPVDQRLLPGEEIDDVLVAPVGAVAEGFLDVDAKEGCVAGGHFLHPLC
ncbi:hypothetical protein D3C72_2426020 [compost metagenome]